MTFRYTLSTIYWNLVFSESVLSCRFVSIIIICPLGVRFELFSWRFTLRHQFLVELSTPISMMMSPFMICGLRNSRSVTDKVLFSSLKQITFEIRLWSYDFHISAFRRSQSFYINILRLLPFRPVERLCCRLYIFHFE